MNGGETHEPAGRFGAPDGESPPTEEELRAAYEAELNRITSAEVMMQTAVSLLNLGARRLGAPAPAAEASQQGPPDAPRDLEQVRDAIDGVRALMGVLERRYPKEIGPLRDALSQLQLAYAREARSSEPASAPAPEAPTGGSKAGGPAPEPGKSKGESPGDGPGPAEQSGRLWVPGR